MAKKGNRQRFLLQCEICNLTGYVTTKNVVTSQVAAKGKGQGKDKLELSKYCRNCRKATNHKEKKMPPSKKV